MYIILGIPHDVPVPCTVRRCRRQAQTEASLRGFVAVVMKIVYVVLTSPDTNSSNASAPSLRLKALRRGWLAQVPAAQHFVWTVGRTLDRTSSFKLSGTLSGSIMFDALRAAFDKRGAADWYMIGDDDTHVDPAAVQAFATTADPSLAYGNLYHNVSGSGNPKPWCYSTRQRKPFRLQHSWFTGGSGMLVPGNAATSAIKNLSDVQTWAQASSQCHCGDVPLACALTDLGIGLKHRPTLFLDSCLSCADWLPHAPRRILSCHAVSAFRSYNVHAKRKARRDKEHVKGVLTLRHSRAYHWPANLTNIPPIARMEELRVGLCSPRPALVAVSSDAAARAIAQTATGRRLSWQHLKPRSIESLPTDAISSDIRDATGGGRCAITSWSRDGFGHQLAAALSCEALAMANESYVYLWSNHTALEHHPSDADVLLGFLNHQSASTMQRYPISVPEGRYHANCPGTGTEVRLPPCSSSAVTVCDSCFGLVSPEIAGRLQIRERIAARLRQRVAAITGAGMTCPHRRSHVCVHLRGQGDPGLRKTRVVTSLYAERDAARKRQKKFPASWWRRAIEVAAVEARRSAHHGRPQVVQQAVRISIHTNSRVLAKETFGHLSELADGTPLSIHTSNETFPILELLQEFFFCCETLVVSESSLSWVAALGTEATIIASKPSEAHIGFRYAKFQEVPHT